MIRLSSQGSSSSRQLTHRLLKSRLAAPERLHSSNKSKSRFSTIASRRAYNRWQQQQQPQVAPQSSTPSTTTAANTAKDAAAADAGWPASVRYTGYALAATLGPYAVLWLVANTPFLHTHLIKDESQLQWLRRQFGIPEHEQEIQMLNRKSNETADEKPLVVYKLPLEPPLKERLVAREQDQLDDSDLTLRVTLFSSGSDDMSNQTTVSVHVPASVMARASDLQEYIAGSGLSAVDSSSIIAIDFPTSPSSSQENSLESDADEATAKMMDSSVYDNHDTTTMENENTVTKDPLLAQTTVYSSWHHHNNLALAATSNTNNSTTASTTPLSQQQLRQDDDARKQQLQFEIRALEDELQGRSLRDIDDLQRELQQKRAQLRKLQWKRWVPW